MHFGINGLLLQALWDWIRAQQNLLRSPVFHVLFSLTVYLSCCLPYLCLDLISSKVALVRQFKIQPHSQVTWTMVWGCLSTVIHTHVFFIFPVIVLHWYWRPVLLPVPAPELCSVVRDVLACLLLFDTQYFVWHLLHHRVPWLYQLFHKEHHRYTATFSLTTEHSGAWETLSLSFFAVASPALLGCHPLTEMLFYIVNIFLLVPFGLYGGALHHDLHHLRFKVNYEPYFTHWDRLFGTLYRVEVDT
uniref:Cholesterol 25-hydroxylase n=1 Tax=Myripristis murdjan TaxID=586833 RepID=A0A667Y582_9TELE